MIVEKVALVGALCKIRTTFSRSNYSHISAYFSRKCAFPQESAFREHKYVMTEPSGAGQLQHKLPSHMQAVQYAKRGEELFLVTQRPPT